MNPKASNRKRVHFKFKSRDKSGEKSSESSTIKIVLKSSNDVSNYCQLAMRIVPDNVANSVYIKSNCNILN